jgi:hypothetical protein
MIEADEVPRLLAKVLEATLPFAEGDWRVVGAGALARELTRLWWEQAADKKLAGSGGTTLTKEDWEQGWVVLHHVSPALQEKVAKFDEQMRCEMQQLAAKDPRGAAVAMQCATEVREDLQRLMKPPTGVDDFL